MMPVKIDAKQKKAITASVVQDFRDQLTELQWEYWDDTRELTSLQEDILGAIHSHLATSVERVVADFLKHYDIQLDVKENQELAKLKAENKRLRADNKEYAAIAKLLKAARDDDR